MAKYKVYAPSDNPLFFDTLAQVKKFFELSDSDVYKIFTSVSRCTRVTAWDEVEIEVITLF